MGMFENVFGGRENAGFDAQAVPQNGPGDTTEEEAGIIEVKRLRKEELDTQIADMEKSPDPDFKVLGELQAERRKLEEPPQ